LEKFGWNCVLFEKHQQFGVNKHGIHLSICAKVNSWTTSDVYGCLWIVSDPEASSGTLHTRQHRLAPVLHPVAAFTGKPFSSTTSWSILETTPREGEAGRVYFYQNELPYDVNQVERLGRAEVEL